MTKPADAEVSTDDRFLFDLQGFLVLRNVLSTDECEEYLDAVRRQEEADHADQWMEAVGAGRPTRETPESTWPAGQGELKRQQIRLNGLPRLAPIFDRLIDHPRVLPYLNEFVGEQKRQSGASGTVAPQLINTWSISKSVDAQSLGWHRGKPQVDYSYDNGVIRTRMLNVAYFLTENGPEDGCLVALPGSHKSNFDLPWGNYDTSELPGAVAVTGNAGDVFLFSESVIHNGLPKSSKGVRTNVHCNYVHGSNAVVLVDPSNYQHSYFPPTVRTRFTPRQRDMTSWMEFFRWDY